LSALNYVAIAAFVGSLASLYNLYHRTGLSLSGESAVTQQEMIPAVVTIILCCWYFFGFFGLSFVTDSISTSASNVNFEKLVEEEEKVQALEQSSKKDAKPFRGGNEVILPASAGATTIVPKLSLPPDNPVICADTNNPAARPALVETNKSAYDDISGFNYETATDDAILELLVSGALKDYSLEKKLGDYTRAVKLRRLLYEQLLDKKLELIPYEHYDYGKIFGANCEIVLGYVPIPLGIVGPLNLNGQTVYIPMATTEGCLVASTNRGCKALTASGGCQSVLLKDAITRAPCLRFSSAVRAAECKKWLQEPDNYAKIEKAFNSTTNFGKLVSVDTTIAGRNAFLRFCCMSGEYSLFVAI